MKLSDWREKNDVYSHELTFNHTIIYKKGTCFFRISDESALIRNFCATGVWGGKPIGSVIIENNKFKNFLRLSNKTRKITKRDISSSLGCDIGAILKSEWSQIGITGFTNSSGIWQVNKLLSGWYKMSNVIFFTKVWTEFFSTKKEASGFRPLSMDKSEDETCETSEHLFVHATLPRNLLSCQISDLVIGRVWNLLIQHKFVIKKNLIPNWVMRSPQNLIRSEYLQYVESPSLNDLRHVSRNYNTVVCTVYENLWLLMNGKYGESF